MFEQWTAERLKSIKYGAFPIPPKSDRKFWTALDKKYTDELKAKADEDINRDYPVILATDYLEFTRSGDRNCMESKHYLRRDALGRLAITACVTDDKKYLDTIINLMFIISEETFWGVSAHFGVASEDKLLPHPDIEYIDLYAAETACQIALTLHMLGDDLRAAVPGLVEEMYRQIDRRILTPFETHEDWWWQGYYRKVNNWNPWIISNIISVLALVPIDSDRQAKLYEKCFVHLSNFLQYYPADGGCDEGANYWGVAGGALFKGLEILYIISGGKIDFFGEPLIKNIARYMTAVHVCGPYFLNYADCGSKPANYSPIIYRYGKMTGDGDVKSLGISLFRLNDGMCLPRTMRDLVMNMACVNEMRAESSAPVAPLDSVLPDLQLAMFRQSRTENDGICISVKGGNNNESHNHNDVGSIICYINGNPAVIDVGCGTYTRQTFSTERYSIWTMQSAWHNLPTVNGENEINGKEYCASLFKAETGDTSTATVEFAGAYGENAGLTSLTRAVTLSRADRTASVKDTFVFKNGKNAVGGHLMFCKKPTVCENVVTAETLTGDKFTVTFDKSANVTVEENVLTDNTIRRSWGVDSLWRVTAEYSTEGKEINTEFKIKAD